MTLSVSTVEPMKRRILMREATMRARGLFPTAGTVFRDPYPRHGCAFGVAVDVEGRVFRASASTRAKALFDLLDELSSAWRTTLRRADGSIAWGDLGETGM